MSPTDEEWIDGINMKIPYHFWNPNDNNPNFGGRDRKEFERLWKLYQSVLWTHIGGLYMYSLLLSGTLTWWTVGLHVVMSNLSMIGVVLGVHGLWLGSNFKATLCLRILLCIFQTMSCQGSIYDTCKQYKMDSLVMQRVQPENTTHVSSTGLNVSNILTKVVNLETDSIVNFQNRYYRIMVSIFGFFLPWYIPIHFGETWINSCLAIIARLTLTLQLACLTKLFGWESYTVNERVSCVEKKLEQMYITSKGWHNYHQRFPWDIQSMLMPRYSNIICSSFITFCVNLGWIYELGPF